jgi:hypothetical protein
MKQFILFFIFISIQFAVAQNNKVVRKAEEINNKSQQVKETSARIRENANQVAANTQLVVQNAKAIVKIFEPIFAIHFKRKAAAAALQANNDNSSQPVASNINTSYADNTTMQQNGNANAAAAEGYNVPKVTGYNPGIPENGSYNPDGSANLGNQYNAEYGCYLNALTGTVLYGGEAEENPAGVDLIFLAPNDGQNAYYLITPGFAHDGRADCFWGSCTTDNPTRSWSKVNESEVALTNLTGAQFEKIQYNTQLSGAVKGTRGFAGWYSSPGSKLDGKVFAVKTEMESRTAYALIYVVKQVGTSGSGGYLKLKVKVTGVDTNGDGSPDAGAYQR